MTRDEKQREIENLGDKVKRSVAFFVADYKGVNVEQITGLRKQLSQSNQVEIKVVKNSLFLKAIEKETYYGQISEYFTGTNAVIFAFADPAAPAKAISKFAETVDPWKIKAGLLKGHLISEAGVKALADLPPREVLLAKLMGSMNAPSQNLVLTLAAVPRSVLNVLNAIKEKKEKVA